MIFFSFYSVCDVITFLNTYSTVIFRILKINSQYDLIKCLLSYCRKELRTYKYKCTCMHICMFIDMYKTDI